MARSKAPAAGWVELGERVLAENSAMKKKLSITIRPSGG